MVSASKVSSSSHETTLAKEAARTQMETLMSMDYRQAFTRFNASAADDPAAPTLSPGANFNVEGLEPLEADADGMAGEIIFPADSLNPTQLREDLSDVTLGCPMDLNGDQLIDSADHSSDFLCLPVVVRVTWQGASGPSQVQLRAVLGALQ